MCLYSVRGLHGKWWKCIVYFPHLLECTNVKVFKFPSFPSLFCMTKSRQLLKRSLRLLISKKCHPPASPQRSKASFSGHHRRAWWKDVSFAKCAAWRGDEEGCAESRSDGPDVRASGCALAVASSRLRDASEMYRRTKKVTLEQRMGINHTDVRGRKAFSLKQKQNKLIVQIKHALLIYSWMRSDCV